MNSRLILIFVALLAQLTNTGAALAEQSNFANLKPTPEMVLEAKKNPNGWVYVIAGNYRPNDAVPREAIAGAWKVDSSGTVVAGSFQANPKYKPNHDK